jgi:excisionase family DNA binding protein
VDLEAGIRRLVHEATREAVRAEMSAVVVELTRQLRNSIGPATTDYLSAAEAAAVVGTHPETVRRWIKSGALKVSGPPRVPRIRRRDLDAFMDTARDGIASDVNADSVADLILEKVAGGTR